VSRTETEATCIDEDNNIWSVSGFKWFSSATDSDMTFLLARPTDATGGSGSKGLSLFYAQMRDEQGKLNGVR
jgi:alkylation response protein AidB-like acyl-CoA dehydrogenase